MCGDHDSRVSLGGALAVLSPSPFRTSTSPIPTAGRLIFHSRKIESSIATHAIFTADPSHETQLVTLEPCLVRIHETGDLTRPLTTSPSWATFSLKPAIGELKDQRWSMEVELDRPMKIEVGVDGIIGRRVSVWTQQGAGPVAEGIVGYN
ncbi:hypothetical protein GGS24DRAFT_500901 [Hypoxylon argillaceum]|nr:hypothetical protein GGS24DRAFT_500901 [Hypoxylon argillaceum]